MLKVQIVFLCFFTINKYYYPKKNRKIKLNLHL